MTIRKSLRTTWLAAALAAAISLIAAAPGLGAPAGDEYLPAVPSAKGDQGGGGGGGAAAGAGAGAVAVDGAATVPGSATGNQQAGSPGGEAKDKRTKPETATAVTVASEEDSSGVLDTLLDPVVLLLIGGVLVVAVGMMLRRGQGDDQGHDPDRAPRDRSAAPHTPHGEILADGDPDA